MPQNINVIFHNLEKFVKVLSENLSNFPNLKIGGGVESKGPEEFQLPNFSVFSLIFHISVDNSQFLPRGPF